MSKTRSGTRLVGHDGSVISRRAFMQCTLGASAAGATILSTSAAAQYGGSPGAMPGAGGADASRQAPGPAGRRKVSKAAARYQDRPRGQQRCGRCAHFLAPNSCEVVAGRISPNGWSRFFEQV